MSDESRLFLVDGSALVHRAYHAYPNLSDRNGNLISVVYGVASMLSSALIDERPDFVCVAWDVKGPTFRHERYIAYKANRPKTDEELLNQIPKTKEMIDRFGIRQVGIQGFEADDLIGSLARKFYDVVDVVVIMTGDQDLMQLVNGKVSVLLPPRGKVSAKLYGESEVLERYGVHPKQIVDYKALVGDPSDNIPGVRGVGPKTASRLLREFGSLDGVYDAVERYSGSDGGGGSVLSDRLVAQLRDGRDSAYLSRDLAKIKDDVDVNVELEDLRFEGLVNDEVREFLESVGFRSLIRRIFGDVKKKDDRQGSLF